MRSKRRDNKTNYRRDIEARTMMVAVLEIQGNESFKAWLGNKIKDLGNWFITRGNRWRERFWLQVRWIRRTKWEEDHDFLDIGDASETEISLEICRKQWYIGVRGSKNGPGWRWKFGTISIIGRMKVPSWSLDDRIYKEKIEELRTEFWGAHPPWMWP